MKGKILISWLALCLCLWPGLESSKAWAGAIGSENDVFYCYEPARPAISQKENKNKSNSKIAVTAAAAVLMDADTGQLLFAKNPHQQRPIASTTKIMTALVAIECGNIEGVATVSKKAAGVGGSSIYLQAGERLPLRELLYGALMHSGNDACVAIAENVAGREEIFVAMMNQLAKLLGANNTNFRNTNGLPDDKHLSTACDLALITRYALQNPVFHQMVSTKNKMIHGSGDPRRLSNTNQMLWGYQGADGVKTGTTSAAGKCLVSSATRDGHRLIAVVLHSADRYKDSERLLDYGFENYKKMTFARKGDSISTVSVADGVRPRASVTVDKDVTVTVPLKAENYIEWEILSDAMIPAPVRKNRQTGRIQIFAGGELLTETGLQLNENVAGLPWHELLWTRIKKTGGF